MHDTLHPAIRMIIAVNAFRVFIAVHIACTPRSALLMPGHIMHTAVKAFRICTVVNTDRTPRFALLLRLRVTARQTRRMFALL